MQAFSLLWKTGSEQVLDLENRGEIMGILNVTPDSFSDGGIYVRPSEALDHGMRLIDEGAAIIDVGGESTRPGAPPVEADEEARRVLPVIEGLRARAPGILISIDTMKAEVARAALAAGADILNDVTGLTGDPAMVEVAAASACGVVVMHMQGSPRTMQKSPQYEDVVAEVAAYLEARRATLVAAGIAEQRLVFDPGIGFGKTLEHNLALLRHLDRLAPAGRPLLLGVSRKSFIAPLIGDDALSARDAPTVALTSHARELGVRVVRVHEVRPNVEAMRMTEAVLAC